MESPILTKNYLAGGAVPAHRLVKLSADDTVVLAAAASDAIIGASTEIASDSGARCDVHMLGIVTLKSGGVIARGALVTSDASGQAVTASEDDRIAGYALNAAVADDLIPVLLAPSGRITDSQDSVASVTVSSAELLALNATPKTLVAAPGSGKALQLLDAALMLDYNSAAYTGIAAGEDLSIKYTGTAGAELAQIEATGFLDQTSDQVRLAIPAATAASTPVANAPLVLHLLTGEIATGNSPLKVRVRYRVIDTAW